MNFEPSNLLFHGTSLRALVSIFAMGYIDLSPSSGTVSLTADPSVAAHWARLSAGNSDDEVFDLDGETLRRFEMGLGEPHGAVILVDRKSLEAEECALVEQDPDGGDFAEAPEHVREIACDKPVQVRHFRFVAADYAAFAKISTEILGSIADPKERVMAAARVAGFAKAVDWGTPEELEIETKVFAEPEAARQKKGRAPALS